MGKIYKNFYPQIYDLFNLWVAFTKASKGRRGHPSIAAFEYNLEPELIRLRVILILQPFWISRGGTLITQPYYTQVGAGL
ncbi:MAG: hypothetical protein HY869_12110 [Chloroflexi bacterium]|nr:hypothetical protein [Chloroflexota bacterium]